MKIFIITLIILFTSTACNSEKGNDLSDTVNKKLEDLEKSLKKIAPAQKEIEQQATQEMEKFYTFEYKVAEFPKTATAENLQTGLQELGQDRWDCFHIEPAEINFKVFCKRKPKSYLNYVPRVF